MNFNKEQGTKMDVEELEEGDIIRTGVAVDSPTMIIEKIDQNGVVIGHKLGELMKASGKQFRVLNRDFRYREGVRDETKEHEEEVKE